jgi:hypothetical protein
MTKAKRKTCFVIMPYGEKKESEDKPPIDFDEIFEFIIKPPLKSLDIEVIRCDKIPNAGSIHHEMLHHILNDDIAIVDITTLNPNVFYELGVRHTLRRSGTILIRKKGTQSPFNIQGMRTIEYDTSLSGANSAIEKLKKSVEIALSSSASDSLVYDVFPSLKMILPNE